MRGALAGGLAATLAAASVFAAGAAAKNVPSTTYASKRGGYQITIPTAWKLVPRTKAQVQALIAQLKKQKQTTLASTYSAIISTAAGRAGLSAWNFQAFAWPVDPGTPILTEVSVGIVKTSRAYGKQDLKAVGATYANALVSNKGAKVTVPKTVTLPAGPAEFIEATIPAGTGLANGVELYLIPHGKRLYELSFQVDSSLLSSATLFTSIAHRFKIT
jgi:hypothetical protein